MADNIEEYCFTGEDGTGNGGNQAKKPASNDPVVAALTKKVDMLMVKVGGLSNENSELRVLVDGLGKENSGLLAKVDGLMALQQALEREMQYLHERLPSAQLLAEFHHNKEHETAKFELVDNSKGVMWDTSTSHLNVQLLSVKRENGGVSIRSNHGFPTKPINSCSDSLVYAVNYFEVTINQAHNPGHIHVGLTNKDFPMDRLVGTVVRGSFGIAIDGDGVLFQSGVEKPFGLGGFAKNDVVGCGTMVTQKTKNAEAAKCDSCMQKQCVLFFTKNGQLLGTPIPLSSVPSMLYPCVSLQNAGDQVTANFGQQPFKYAIPPAKGLNVCGHCCHCKKFVA